MRRAAPAKRERDDDCGTAGGWARGDCACQTPTVPATSARARTVNGTLATPLGVPTVSETVPGKCAGLTAVIWSGVTVSVVELDLSKVTVVRPGRKSRPVITTEAPPNRGPLDGAAVEIEGPENVSRPTAVPH